jgi:large subunit ribosomal protein L31
MKADIHPTYYSNSTFTCACGAVYPIGSTKEKVSVEICSNCHPFYTGTEKVLDAAGRVDKFNSRRAAAGTATKAKKVSKK